MYVQISGGNDGISVTFKADLSHWEPDARGWRHKALKLPSVVNFKSLGPKLWKFFTDIDQISPVKYKSIDVCNDESNCLRNGIASPFF